MKRVCLMLLPAIGLAVTAAEAEAQAWPTAGAGSTADKSRASCSSSWTIRRGIEARAQEGDHDN